MEKIHKIIAIVISGNKFLMVRKKGKDIWTNLGGKPEKNETEEEALIREIKEEIGTGAKIIKKLKDFESKAIFDEAIVKLSAYLVKIQDEIKVIDDELEEVKFIGKDYLKQGIKLPPSITEQILPYLVEEGYLTKDYLAKTEIKTISSKVIQ